MKKLALGNRTYQDDLTHGQKHYITDDGVAKMAIPFDPSRDVPIQGSADLPGNLSGDDAKALLIQLTAAKSWIELAIAKLRGLPAPESMPASEPDAQVG